MAAGQPVQQWLPQADLPHAPGETLPTMYDLPIAQEQQRAEQASQRAERLAKQLRALGIEPAS